VKEQDWKECLETTTSIKISPDKAKAKSLKDTAVGRNEYLKESKIKEKNANYIFEAYYSSVLEMLHALVLFHGYKVNNHICLGFFLRDVLKKEMIFRLFDDCRFKRNSLVYYGRKMDFKTAENAINKCKRLIKEFNVLLKRKKQTL
jgi:uncharacterized protein (UPF0332 family)